MSISANKQNGQDDQSSQPVDQLDLQNKVIESSGGNPLLELTNLGVGNYSEDYLWQQVRSYRKGLYAYIAFDRALTDLAIHETKVKLAREGFRHYNETRDSVEMWEAIDEDAADVSRHDVLERGEEVWEDLGEARKGISKKQAAALLDKSGLGSEWLPVYWQMVAGRHEVSRSLDAELLRDMMTGIKHLRNDSDDDSAAKILGGS